MTSSPTHPTGQLKHYRDVTGRQQTSVTGPKGTVLITNKRDGDPFEVWFSDELRNLTTATTKTAAIDAAFRRAGIDF